MTAPVRIRPAGRAELELLAALHALAFTPPDVAGPPWSADALATTLAHPGAFALLAVDEEAVPGEPLGLLLAWAVAGEGEILTVGTVPAARRRGVARALMEAALLEMRRRDAEALFLEVAETNGPARRFYSVLGFTEVGRRPGYYRLGGTSVAALVLRRSLDR